MVVVAGGKKCRRVVCSERVSLQGRKRGLCGLLRCPVTPKGPKQTGKFKMCWTCFILGGIHLEDNGRRAWRLGNWHPLPCMPRGAASGGSNRYHFGDGDVEEMSDGRK